MKLILIHGQGRTPLSMALLGWRLSRKGYDIHYFGYFPFMETFDEIVARFTQMVRETAGEQPYAIVSHSLGSLVSRATLPRLSDHPPCHVVMLAPPNQPPKMAKLAQKVPLYRWYARDCGDKLADDDFYESLPVPDVPTTIIAGSRGLPEALSPFDDQLNDGILAVEETELADHEVIVDEATHPFIMNSKQVVRLITEIVGEA